MPQVWNRARRSRDVSQSSSRDEAILTRLKGAAGMKFAYNYCSNALPVYSLCGLVRLHGLRNPCTGTRPSGTMEVETTALRGAVQ